MKCNCENPGVEAFGILFSKLTEKEKEDLRLAIGKQLKGEFMEREIIKIFKP